MVQILFKLFSVRCYAAADDKATNPATVNDNMSAGTILSGLGGTTKFRNIIETTEYPFNDSVCGEKKTVDIFTRENPIGDAEYATLPKGSKVKRLVVSAGEVTDIEEYVNKADGFALNETVHVVELTLTNAQVKALNDTEIEVLESPGSGRIVKPIRGEIRHNYDTAAFALTNVTDFEFKYTDDSGDALVKLPTTDVLDVAANTKAFSSAETNLVGVADAAVVIHAHGSASPITGAGTVTVKLFYQVVDA